MTSGSGTRLHADELDTGVEIARRLVAAQFPQWAGLPLVPLASIGASNTLHRLGTDLVVRLPRIPSVAGNMEKEQRWLPRLAPHLPLAVPQPLGLGAPSADYPCPWSVLRWIDGEDATVACVHDPRAFAQDLGRFVAALQVVDPTGGPPPGEHNGFRGAPLLAHEVPVRTALAALGDLVDVGAATAAWDATRRVPDWRGSPVWHHGDLLPGNLLVDAGRLRAVLDWGCSGVGDPAYDASAAWTTLPVETRPLFRAEVGLDDATWARARGVALSWGLLALWYYRSTHPVLVDHAQRAIAAVLADQRGNR